MEFFRIRRDIPFMKHALVFNVISLITFLLAVFFLATRGLNLGVDFRGGTVIEVAYGHAADLTRVRSAIDKLGLGEFAVQSFGSANSALIRLPLKEGVSTAQLSERVMSALKHDGVAVAEQSVEFVVRQVSAAVSENGTLALMLVLIGIVASLAISLKLVLAVWAIVPVLQYVIITLTVSLRILWKFSRITS